MIANASSGALFGLFTFTMTGSSLQFVFLNTTSVENLSRKVKIHTFAIYMPHPPPPQTIAPFQTITYPIVSASQDHLRASMPASRTFAILHTRAGENPWDLGYYENFCLVMGRTPLDWVLPLRYSPLCDHSLGESDFPLGPVIRRMKEEAGIALPVHEAGASRKRRRSRRGKSRSRDEMTANPS